MGLGMELGRRGPLWCQACVVVKISSINCLVPIVSLGYATTAALQIQYPDIVAIASSAMYIAMSVSHNICHDHDPKKEVQSNR